MRAFCPADSFRGKECFLNWRGLYNTIFTDIKNGTDPPEQAQDQVLQRKTEL